MRIKTGYLILASALLATVSSCNKDKAADAVATESTGGTVVSGASGPWRDSVPADSTPPVANASFWGKAGSRLGAIVLNIKYPADTADYAKIELRRLTGKTPPATCAAGEVVHTITDFAVTAWEDTGLYPGGTYSYIACLSDAAGNNEVAYGNATVNASTEHRMFATSETFDGNLGATYQGTTFASPLIGADAHCNRLAGAAQLTGHWQALLGSNDDVAPYDRVPIFGPVHNLAKAPELLSESKSEFWGGRLQHAVGYDEAGTPVLTDVNPYVWTAFTANGSNYQSSSCAGFSANTGSGIVGDATEWKASGAWALRYVGSCDSKNRLYCVESYEGSVASPTLAGTAEAGTNTADVAISFPADTTAYGSVRLLRQPGKVLENASCSETHPGTKLVKIFSASDANAFAAETIVDATGADGFYNYLACVFDTSGNLIATSTSSFVSLGTNYKSAFITSQSFDGNLGGVAGANTKCGSAATAASLSGTWHALLADGTHDIFHNLASQTVNIYDLDGNYLASSYAELGYSYYVGSNAIATDETKAAVAAGTKVWTGADNSGGSSASVCTDWSTAGSGVSGTYGESLGNYGAWLSRAADACNNTHRLYCIQN